MSLALVVLRAVLLLRRPTPMPPLPLFLLLEDGNKILLEDGYKILLENFLLLLEDGNKILLEDGDKILLEN